MSKVNTKPSLLPPLWVLTLILVGLTLWIAYELKEIVVLLVLGYCISYVIEPLVAWFERRGVPRSRGVILIASLAVVLLLLLIIIAVPPLIREGSELVENLPANIEMVRSTVAPYIESWIDDKEGPIYELVHSPFTALQKIGKNFLPKILDTLSTVLLSGYSITLTIINLALLPFIVYYLSLDFSRIRGGFLDLFPESKKEQVDNLLNEIDSYTSSFVRGQIIVCTVLFLLYSAGLGILGVELWFVLAVISGYGNLIPYFGFLVGIVLSTIMAIVTFGDLTHVLSVWGIFAVVQFLEGTFITPKIIGNSVGLSPLFVILAIVAGGTLFGLLGVFLAVPGAAVLKVLVKHLYAWMIRFTE